jgi:ribosomal protein S15P/S13E
MNLTPAQQELRDRFFRSLLDATLALKQGPDPEVTLEMLIAAVQRLEEHLEQELAELRLEQAD